MLSVAKGLTLNGLNISSQLKALEKERDQAKRWTLKVAKEWDDAKPDLCKAREKIGVARDEAEEAKLELLQAKKSFKEELVKAREEARTLVIRRF